MEGVTFGGCKNGTLFPRYGGILSQLLRGWKRGTVSQFPAPALFFRVDIGLGRSVKADILAGSPDQHNPTVQDIQDCRSLHRQRPREILFLQEAMALHRTCK